MRLTGLGAVIVGLPALASAQPFTFVSTPANDSLVAIDLASNTVVGPVPVGGLPMGCAVGRSGKRVYAALSEANALAIVNVGTGAVRTVPVGARPSAVAVIAGKAYVTNTAADTVSVVSAGRGGVLATITVGDSPVAIAAGGDRVYVANSGGGTVSVIDIATNSVAATIPVGNLPAGLALHVPSHRLYVANFLDDSVSVIDTGTLAAPSTIAVARRPRGLAVDAAGQRLFVAGFDDGRVQAIDTGNGAVTLDASSGGFNPVDLMIGPEGTRLYVAHLQETMGLAVLDAATLAPMASVDVPSGPVAFAGMAKRRPRPPLATGGQTLARALSVPLRAIAAMAAPGRSDSIPSLAPPVVISDGAFNLLDWSTEGNAEWDNVRVATEGNPGAWRRTTHFALASSSMTVHLLFRMGSTYDPAAQGPIMGIDVSWDRKSFSDDVTGEGFVVEQDGVLFRTSERLFSLPAWSSDSRTNLQPGDFDDGGGGHPDFGVGGNRLRFGYFRRTPPNRTVAHGIDNFVVTVHVGESPATVLGFQKILDSIRSGDAPFVYVQRHGSPQGAVSVDVRIERPDGTTDLQTVSWADGESWDRPILLLFLDLPDGSAARTARLTLLDPTGGAVIDPSREAMVIAVVPEHWGPQIEALYLRLLAVLGDFSPAWILALAVPAILAARRERRRTPSRRVLP